MSTERELVEFSTGAPEAARSWMETVLADGTGSWLNVEPVVDDVDVSELTVRRGVMGWLSGRGSDLPFTTVVGASTGRRPTAASLGIEHGSGPKAARRLAAAGVVVPAGWRRRQDHPKRGLVYEQDGPVDPVATLDFIFDAVTCLCPTPLGDRWSMVRHTVR